MDLPTFRSFHPEFVNVPDPLVTAELGAALLFLDAGVWGNKIDQGQRFRTAHQLALSPFGQAARMVAKDGSTTYETHYKRMIREVASGYRST